MKTNSKKVILTDHGYIFTIEDENGNIVKAGFNNKNPDIKQLFNKRERGKT